MAEIPRKKFGWKIGLLILVLLVIAGGIIGWQKFFREEPQPDWVMSTPDMRFKYGSIGAEYDAGIPYWIFYVLPRMFPEKLPGPGGYASLGVAWEQGQELPIGFTKKVIGFPERPVILMLKALEFLKLSPLYKWIYETASKDSFVSTDKARRILGFTPRYSNKEALIRNYKWYLDHLDEFDARSGITHREPWRQGILRIAKMFF